MRLHWFDLGFAFALVTGGILALNKLNPLSFLLWVSLISLFLHQLEEYRYPGYFPGMINSVLFSSKQPDRFPLNSNTALIVNVVIGWSFYFLAAVFAENAVWLGVATILVSLGNFVAHTVLFNLKGKRFYNPGMVTVVILFLPILLYFFYFVIEKGLVSPIDWGVGIILGIALNYLGILKVIDWLKDENSSYIFPKRCLMPEN